MKRRVKDNLHSTPSDSALYRELCSSYYNSLKTPLSSYDAYKYYIDRCDTTHRYDMERFLPYETPYHLDFLKRYYFVSEEPFVELFNDANVRSGLRLDCFDKLMSQNVQSKSPGSPLCYLTSTNAGLNNFYHEIYDTVNSRLVSLFNIGVRLFDSPSVEKFYPSNFDDVAVNLVTSDVMDPVLINPKGEPRAVSNGVQKVPRLVSQVSVITNMIQRLVFGSHLYTEQESEIDRLPVATRLDLSTESERHALYEKLRSHAPLSSSDVQGYEYSVNRWLRYLHAIKACYCMLLSDDNMRPLPGKEFHFYTLWGLVYSLSHKVVQTQEGLLLVPPPGSMSSGELITFSENSHDRSWLSYYVNKLSGTLKEDHFLLSAGDDNLDSSCYDLSHVYASLGFIITDFEIQEDRFTFCSTTFSDSGSYGNNIAKYCYAAILSCRTLDYTLQSEFDMLYFHHPQHDVYWGMLCEKLSSPLVVMASERNLENGIEQEEEQ